MNPAMRDAFRTGSGVDPLNLKLTLTLSAVGVILVVCTWIVVQLIDAYRDEQIRSEEVVLGLVRLVILAGLVIFMIV
mgnify:FL=1